jgi:4-hydroxy-4-methyl-2-oxoglutarate aldolase
MNEWVAKVAALGSATIHEAQQRTGALDPAIRAVWDAPPMAGYAYTVRCHPGDNLAVHRAVAAASPGDVLLVDAGGHVAGYWGEILTVAAQARGIAGLVIDGGCRDVMATSIRGFGVWARGVSVQGCTKLVPGWIGEEIGVGGVVARAGDMVVADRDGVVLVRAGEIATVVAAADAREQREQDYMRRLAAGELTLDLLGLRDHLPVGERN